MNRISTIKKEYLKEEFIKQIKDNYTLEIALILLEEFEQLQQENKQLKLDYELYKDNHIYKNYEVERKDNTIEQLKEVIEEVREYIEDSCYYPELENYSNMTSNEVKELLQILDKVKENK